MRLLIKSMIYSFALIVVVGGLAFAFHDSMFRWLAVRLTQQVPGLEARFDGGFDVTHAFPLTLETGQVGLAFEDAALKGTEVELGEVRVAIRTWPLLTGAVHIERLRIADAEIVAPNLQGYPKAGQTQEAVRIPVIESLLLERVNLRLRLRPDAPQHTLDVIQLRVGVDESGKVTGTGSGSLNGDALELTAAFGSVSEFLRPTAPFPVDVAVRAPARDMEIHVSGTLGQPAQGLGAALDLRLASKDISPMRDILLPGAPFGGTIDARARVSGDLRTPVLSDIDLTIDDGDRVRLVVRGDVTDFKVPKGMDLQVDVSSRDLAATQYLTLNQVPVAHTLRYRAAVRGDVGNFRIQDLEVEIQGDNDLSFGVRGAAHVSDLGAEWPLEEADLDLHLSGRVADAAAWLPDELPKAGKVHVKTHVQSSTETVVFSNVDISLDATEPVRGTLQGELSYLVSQLKTVRARERSPDDVWVPEEVDVVVDLETSNLKSLSDLFETTLAVQVPVAVKARIRRNGDAVEVTELDARSIGAGSSSLAASGELTVRVPASGQQAGAGEPGSAWPVETAQVDLQLTAAVADLAAWLPDGVRDAGTVRAKGRIDGSIETLAFTDLDIVLDKTRPVSGTIQGEIVYSVDQIDTMQTPGEPPTAAWFPAQADLSVDLATGDLASVSALVGNALPDLGGISAKARLQRVDEDLQVTEIDARTSGQAILDVTTRGQLTISDITAGRQLRDVALELVAAGPDAGAAKPLIGPLPIETGPWALRGRIESDRDKLRVDALEFESGRADTVRVEVDGSIADLAGLLQSKATSPSGVTLEGHLNGPSIGKLGALIGLPIPNLGRFEAQFEATGDSGDWSIPTALIDVTDGQGFDVKLIGKADRLLRESRFESRLEVRIPDPQGIVARAGGALPPISPIAVDGQLEGSRDQAGFEGHIEVGSTRFDTDLEIALSKARPLLAGTVSTPVLRLDDFITPRAGAKQRTDAGAAPDSTPAGRAAGNQDQVFSRKPLRFDLLEHADLDLKLIAEKIEGKQIRTERLELEIVLDDRRLKAGHRELKHSTGSLKTSLQVDTAVDPPQVSFESRGDNIQLGTVHAQVSDASQLLQGNFSFDYALTGAGRSAHEMVSTANGRFGHIIEEAKLTGGDIDLLAFDSMSLIMSALVSKDHTEVECAIAQFDVENGVAASKTLFLKTPKLIVAGVGQIDLANETLDVLLNTDARKFLLFDKKSELRVHGPWKHPELDADLAGQALGTAATTSAMVALPPLGFSMAGISYLGGFVDDGETRPCVPAN